MIDTESTAHHLRGHLTDGRWHDDCLWCCVRRIHGGTGTPPDTQPATDVALPDTEAR